MTMQHQKKAYTYFPEEVIAFRDDDHTPYNKRAGSCDSVCTVQVRAPIKKSVDWVNFTVEETTTTKNYGEKPDRTQSRTISFILTREQFAAIVAHVNRKA